MITLIVYISPNDFIDPDYKRIFLLEERKRNIIFLHARYDDFKDSPEEVYKAVSNEMRQYGRWKLILVDDSRYLCNRKNDGCSFLCTGGRNHYKNYVLRNQVAVFSGEIDNPSYTAGIPTDLLVILTRGDKEQCQYEITATQAESTFCVNFNLPGHGRYLVFDFFGKGDYLQEKREWQLFFLLWILSQESVSTDCFLAHRIYKISVNWEEDDLQGYLAEMKGQLQRLKNQINNGRLYPAKSIEPDYHNKIISNFRGYSIPQITYGRSISGMKRTVGEQICIVREKQKRIKKEIEEKFNKIRKLDWREAEKGKESDYQNYENILDSHYHAGNADYRELEEELESIEERIAVYEGSRYGLFGAVVEILIIIVVISSFFFYILEENKIFDSAILGMSILILVFFMMSKIYVKGGSIDIKWELENLLQKADWIMGDKVKRINTQFAIMVKYKSYVSHRNWILEREKESEKEDEANNTNRKELEYAEAVWNRLKKFTEKPILENWDYADPLSEEEERFFYPQGWEKKKTICRILNQDVLCPYYFIKEIDVSAELEKEEEC